MQKKILLENGAKGLVNNNRNILLFRERLSEKCARDNPER